ncbi:hypothetical protein [Defluviimonas salinarum]|uniref:Uncharacterized protein n=1 Tax=Defluviimonas salinarum TaxID=2992147 RepID=A0ABT3J4B3_9RHOB|nr:hypothetical protein [Defluviimonas salinarum]MCW3782517.1 hypothetical protein [Defluviimonas salinarum]
MDHLVCAASDLVRHGMTGAGIPLTAHLEHYLSVTVARFMAAPLNPDRLTLRILRAFDAAARPPELRHLADECLLAVSLFEDRLRRTGGSLRHYCGLGQASYEAAGLPEQACGFCHMRDVLVAACGSKAADPARLVDAARAGSGVARRALAECGVIPFPGRPRFS